MEIFLLARLAFAQTLFRALLTGLVEGDDFKLLELGALIYFRLGALENFSTFSSLLRSGKALCNGVNCSEEIYGFRE